MELLKWNDLFRLGLEEPDDHHRKLIELLNGFYQAIQLDGGERAIEKALFTLTSYAKHHFHVEEDLMEKQNFPGLNTQRIKNEEIKEKLSALKAAMTAQGKEVQSEILKYMKEWILEHINEHKKTYALYIKEKKLTDDDLEKKKIDLEKKKVEPVFKPVFSLITWRKEFDLGIEKIDEQHRRLADIINTLCDTINYPDKPSKTQRVLNEVSAYIQYHFDYEEGLLARHKYKYLHTHIEEHEKFTKGFRRIEQRFKTFKTVVDHDFMLFLRDWFIRHTQTVDRRYIDTVSSVPVDEDESQ